MQKILTNRIASLIILIVILVIAGCSGAPVKPDQTIPGNYDYAKEYLTWLTHKEMKHNKVMGVSIAIVDDQKVVWAQGFGYSDKKNKIPATAETVYRIGSISKLFTVMAAMKLAEQGKVEIDRPLKKYLPQFSIQTRFSDSGPITPRTIMTHHSGLPSNVAKGMWTSEPPVNLLNRLKDEYAAYPTNYVLAYSNGKFGVERKDLGIFPVKKIGDLELSKIQIIPVNIDGRQLLSIRYNNSLWFYAEKINPSPLPNSWHNMLGRYQIVNPDPKGSPQDMILSIEEDVLVLRYKNPLWHPGEAKHYLITRSDTEALTLGIGRSSGETMRMIAIDGETGLLIGGYQMKKI